MVRSFDCFAKLLILFKLWPTVPTGACTVLRRRHQASPPKVPGAQEPPPRRALDIVSSIVTMGHHMPTPGLTLAGFLDEPAGIQSLRDLCVFPDVSDDALRPHWQAARAQLGPATPSAGYPKIDPLPASAKHHMDALMQKPWLMQSLHTSLLGAAFQMVELAPLIAYQLTVDCDRSDHHNGGAAHVPAEAEIFAMCLPLDPVVENVQVHQQSNNALITSAGLNFRTFQVGFMNTPFGHFVGVQVGPSVPLLHVVRYNGRCYLHNGFHRAVGLLKRGITHAPCVVRDVPDAAAAGINPPGTFSTNVLEAADPPTVAHFANGRAYDVTLKRFKRSIHVSWSDYVITED